MSDWNKFSKDDDDDSYSSSKNNDKKSYRPIVILIILIFGLVGIFSLRFLLHSYQESHEFESNVEFLSLKTQLDTLLFKGQACLNTISNEDNMLVSRHTSGILEFKKKRPLGLKAILDERNDIFTSSGVEFRDPSICIRDHSGNLDCDLSSFKAGSFTIRDISINLADGEFERVGREVNKTIYVNLVLKSQLHFTMLGASSVKRPLDISIRALAKVLEVRAETLKIMVINCFNEKDQLVEGLRKRVCEDLGGAYDKENFPNCEFCFTKGAFLVKERNLCSVAPETKKLELVWEFKFPKKNNLIHQLRVTPGKRGWAIMKKFEVGEIDGKKNDQHRVYLDDQNSKNDDNVFNCVMRGTLFSIGYSSKKDRRVFGAANSREGLFKPIGRRKLTKGIYLYGRFDTDMRGQKNSCKESQKIKPYYNKAISWVKERCELCFAHFRKDVLVKSGCTRDRKNLLIPFNNEIDEDDQVAMKFICN
jgi:hypothetical protein